MDKIQEIFTAPWAIADNDYYRLLSLLVPCVAAGNLDAIEKRLDNNKITAYATTPYLANRWELDDETLPADSVAVIILEGTLYSWETYRLEKQLRDVFDNPKICGAVLWINGPGGMVAHVDLAAKMIAESSKPIATYVADAISRNLGIAYDPELPLFRGQIFTGDVAVANGYIDQFGTLEDAVKWVLAQATVRKVNEMYNI